MDSGKTYYDTIELSCRVGQDHSLAFFRDIQGKDKEQTNLDESRKIHYQETFRLHGISLEITPVLPDPLQRCISEKDQQNIYALLRANLQVRINDRLYADVNRVGLLGYFQLREPVIINDRDEVQGSLTLANEYDGRYDKTPYRVKLVLHGEEINPAKGDVAETTVK